MMYYQSFGAGGSASASSVPLRHGSVMVAKYRYPWPTSVWSHVACDHIRLWPVDTWCVDFYCSHWTRPQL